MTEGSELAVDRGVTDAWEFAVDRGGTFTDCIGVAPDGSLHTAKVLSSDTAPVEGIRLVLERAGALAPGAELPTCRVRLGTTVATNALLERRGTPTLLVADAGLGDLLAIGTQERPELFDLERAPGAGDACLDYACKRRNHRRAAEGNALCESEHHLGTDGAQADALEEGYRAIASLLEQTPTRQPPPAPAEMNGSATTAMAAPRTANAIPTSTAPAAKTITKISPAAVGRRERVLERSVLQADELLHALEHRCMAM